MRNMRKILSVAAAFFLTSAIPLSAFAAYCSGGGSTIGLCNPLATDSLTDFLANLLKLVAEIGFPVIVLFIVYIGFLFIAAEGNPKKLASARSYLFWAIVGALIVLGAQALSYAIQATVTQLQSGT